MSTPVDIPQNINIHVTHLDKVVEPPKSNVADNSADHSSLEFTHKGPDQKKQIVEKDKEEKRTFQDRYEKNNERQQSKERQEKEKSKEVQEKKINNSNIGTNIDLSI